jgi:hypothetical protein
MEGFMGGREEGSIEKRRTGGACEGASTVLGRDGNARGEMCVRELAVAGRCPGLRGDRLGLVRVDEMFGSSCQCDVGEREEALSETLRERPGEHEESWWCWDVDRGVDDEAPILKGDVVDKGGRDGLAVRSGAIGKADDDDMSSFFLRDQNEGLRERPCAGRWSVPFPFPLSINCIVFPFVELFLVRLRSPKSSDFLSRVA